jgi:UDP-N-acetylenolpyruvoylglucosamine reductase
MMDQVVSVTLLDEDGVIRTRYRSELEVQYRNVPQLRRQYALQAVLAGVADEPEAIAGRWQASRDKRRLTQPVKASAGCTFKNPAPMPAGKLIDELGLKGWREGAAEVSAIHGNFIVNTGGASAEQVLRLIERVQHEVRERCGVELELEVKVIGEEEATF